MSNKIVLLVFVFVLMQLGCKPMPPTEGFAGLGATADEFAQVVPGNVIEYPAALNQHPEYRIEWWYITANLQTETGEPLGIQWTLFRYADAPAPQREGWASQQRWLGHVGLTRANQHFFADTYARGGIHQAGVQPEPFNAWIDNWSFVATDRDATHFTLHADTADFSYALTLKKQGPAILHGEQGVSVKSSAGQASYYLSLPFLAVSGEIKIAGEQLAVTGDAWLDREWSSQPLAANQLGWDWFSLHLANGDKLMLFRLRHADAADYFSGTYIAADGRTQPLQSEQISMQPIQQHSVAGKRLPVAWQLTVADLGIAIEARALNPNAWMGTGIAYWEGPISVTGSHSGKGYLEMTGY